MRAGPGMATFSGMASGMFGLVFVSGQTVILVILVPSASPKSWHGSVGAPQHITAQVAYAIAHDGEHYQ